MPNTVSINDRLGPGGLDSVAIIETDAAGVVSLVDVPGNVIPPLGSRCLTVGAGGMYATLEEAVTAAGSRWVTSKQMVSYDDYSTPKASFTATFTNGSAAFTKTAGQNFQGYTGLVGQEFILVDGKYYRVKETTSTTAGTLYGPFGGTTGSYTCTPLLLSPITILLMPGEHSSSNAAIVPGVTLAGLDKATTFLVEDQTGSPLNVHSMTQIANLSFAPNTLYGSLERLVMGIGPNMTSYGCSIRMSNVRIVHGDERGPHGSGSILWPNLPGGKFILENSNVTFGSMYGGLNGAGEAGQTSRIIFRNTSFDWFKGATTSGIQAAFLELDALVGPVVVDVINCYSMMEDCNLNTTANAYPVAAFIAADAKTTINIVGGKHTVANHLAAAALTEFPAVVASFGGTINIEGGAVLEATGSTTSDTAPGTEGVAAYNNGGTINVRTGCRLKGDTDAIVCAAGTVNISAMTDIINGTSGVGTINVSTPT